MPKTRLTRKDRKEKQRDNYLTGKARSPHTHTHTLRRSLEGTGEGFDGERQGERNSAVYPQCQPVLSCHANGFKEMIHQGTELKKRKKVNPSPKCPESEFTHIVTSPDKMSG